MFGEASRTNTRLRLGADRARRERRDHLEVFQRAVTSRPIVTGGSGCPQPGRRGHKRSGEGPGGRLSPVAARPRSANRPGLPADLPAAPAALRPYRRPRPAPRLLPGRARPPSPAAVARGLLARDGSPALGRTRSGDSRSPEGGDLMDDRSGRRSFLGSLGAGGVVAAMVPGPPSAEAAQDQETRPDGGQTYTGKSEPKRTFLEAVDEATNRAIAEAKRGVGSTLVVWTLDRLSCDSGGFAGTHIATVTIQAQAPVPFR